MDATSAKSAIDDLINAYSHALDSKDMTAWLGCFAEDGTYLCQTRESFEEEMPVGFMWDDRAGRLKDRVKAITEIWAGTAEDYQPRHFCQRLAVSLGVDGLYDVTTNFVLFYTTNRGDSAVLATGEYLDRVRLAGERAQLVSRKAILDQMVVPRYLVYPV